MSDEQTPMFLVTDTSVYFFLEGRTMVFHKSFTRRFYMDSVVGARRKLKLHYTHREQDIILTYLKHTGIVKG